MLGLGCEMLPAQSLLDGLDLPADKPVTTLVIQETGGIRATVRAGVAAIEAMLPAVDALRREPGTGLRAGARPATAAARTATRASPPTPRSGVAADLLVAHGGTAVLGETPEIYGAEHLLMRRAVSPEVGEKLVERIDWWEWYTAAGGGTIDNNPSPGNKAGGLTTIYEKSLGAVAKGGTAPAGRRLRVRRAGHRPRLRLHGHPRLRPGLRRPAWSRAAPTSSSSPPAAARCSAASRRRRIKVATNTADVRAHGRRHGPQRRADRRRHRHGTSVGEELFELIIAVASGQQTVSEELDLGADEFIPWQLGAVT